MKEYAEELKRSLDEELLMIENDDNVQQQQVLSIKDVEMEQCEDHLKNFNMNLMMCAHFHVLSQEKRSKLNGIAHTHFSYITSRQK